MTGGNGVVILLIQVSYSGVINSNDFDFIIFIYQNDLEEGMYSFTVQSSNPYGMSEVTELTDEVIVRPGEWIHDVQYLFILIIL